MLTAYYQYSGSNADNLPLPVQMPLSEKLETFSGIFIEIFPICFKCTTFWKKKMSLMAQIFLKLMTPKEVFTYMHKTCSFWKLFGSERFNDYVKLLKSGEKYFYPTFSSVWVNFRYKKPFLVRTEILRLLVNTLTAGYEYSHTNTVNLLLRVQMQLSEKLQTFSGIYISFFQSALNVEHFGK